MKKYIVLALIILLTGCNSFISDRQMVLDAPKTLKYNKKTYYLKNDKDLGAVARYVYFQKKADSKNWNSSIELLLDRNKDALSLAERIDLRKKVYTNTGVEHFDLYEKDNTLYAFVIHAPTEQQNNWQINVSKGKDLEDCGFVQYQYSLKIPKTQKLVKMGKVKLIGYLKKYAVDKELERLIKTEWTLKCKPAPLDTPQSNEQ